MVNPQDVPADRIRAAWRQRVCAVCLERADDGSCHVGWSATCPLDEHLEEIRAAILEVLGAGEEACAEAIEDRVCNRCTWRDSPGSCRWRREGRCALVAYLPLVVESIREAARRAEVEEA